jgi:WD40 repeat protein
VLLAYSPDGKRIVSATGAGSNDIDLWDGESDKAVAVLRGHTDYVPTPPRPISNRGCSACAKSFPLPRRSTTFNTAPQGYLP